MLVVGWCEVVSVRLQKVFLSVLTVVLAGSLALADGQEQPYSIWAQADFYESLTVYINEVEVNSEDDDNDLWTVDWVELYNAGGSAVDVSGWYVEAHIACESEACTWGGIRWSDPIPAGTIIPPHGYCVVRRANRWMTNEGTHALALYAAVRMTYETVLAIRIDLACNGSCDDSYVTFCDTANDKQTIQRIPDGTGDWVRAEGTPGAENSSPSN